MVGQLSHAGVYQLGEIPYSISAVLRFLQNLIVPSVLLDSYLVGGSDLNLARD